MRYDSPLFQYPFPRNKNNPSGLLEKIRAIPQQVNSFLARVKSIGITPSMEGYEKSKLVIFNYLNFFQFITGILVPVIGFLYTRQVSTLAWIMAIAPAFVSLVVLILNVYRLQQYGLVIYFVFYPFLTCLGYINGISLGVELTFVLYGILSVFFIRDIVYMIFSIGFSMISYFVLSVMLSRYPFQLEEVNFVMYLVNHVLAIIYIFYGLYLIKTENANFNSTLQEKNNAMEIQSAMLQVQAAELQQVNSLKNKLFTVISHDLKAPMYALRNLFENIQSQDMPADEIKALIPDIKNDLNYTVSLMENLLQWSKSQMQAEAAVPQQMNLPGHIESLVKVLHLQAEAKNIRIENKVRGPLSVYTDADMINLVLRNILSNAIKFSLPGGNIVIGVNHRISSVEIYVRDSGKGISQEELAKINSSEFYTTNGTAQEQGTGLGLMLCKEFLRKNDSELQIDSSPGKGSTFSFLLPLAQNEGA